MSIGGLKNEKEVEYYKINHMTLFFVYMTRQYINITSQCGSIEKQ